VADDVIHLTVVVHLEGWPAHENIAFQTYAAKVRATLKEVQDHGAVFSWETKNLIEPSVQFDDNILLELQSSGQSVGVHADLGASGSPGGAYDQQKFTAELKSLRTDMQALGVTPRHVSGICSELDWVKAARDAGFEFASGQVAFCLKSLGQIAIPDNYKACASPEECHQPYPSDAEETVFPWRVESGLNWTTPSSDGDLVLFHSSGEIGCAAELRADPTAALDACVLDHADVDAAMANLEAAFAHTDPKRFNTHVVVWSFGREFEPYLLGKWLDRIKPFVTSGRVKWTTLSQMYDDFTAAGG